MFNKCGHAAYWTTVYEHCMACRVETAEKQLVKARAALEQIANNPHSSYDHPSNGGGSYGTGVTDGHRCAAQKARKALEALTP